MSAPGTPEPRATAAGADARTLVRVELLLDGRVLRVVMDRPKGNVLTRAMMASLAAALDAHRDDPHLRLVILRGAGGTFSFGAAIEEHVPDQVGAMLRGFHAFIRALAAYPVPVAALVEGRCLGGGFETALACHLVFATEDARFACPEIRLGVFPPVLAVLGALRLGGALMERLLLTAAELDPAAAARAGFVTAVLEPGRDPEDALLDWYARHLAPLSAFALRVATRAAREGSGLLAALDEPLAATERLYLDRLMAGHDPHEGVAAFLERRAPVWRDA